MFYDEHCKMNFQVRDNKVLLYCIVRESSHTLLHLLVLNVCNLATLCQVDVCVGYNTFFVA